MQEACMLFGICSEKLASASGHSVVESSLPTEIRHITCWNPRQVTEVHTASSEEESHPVVLLSHRDEFSYYTTAIYILVCPT